VSIAVDPNDPDHVYVAFTDVNKKGALETHVYESKDKTKSWKPVFNVPATNTALPALAVNSKGAVGLLYTQLNGKNLETHFCYTTTDFKDHKDAVLSSFPSGDPKPGFGPYIGDYEGLVAVGANFYGAFSASNNPDPKDFPEGVNYQRPVRIGGKVYSNFTLGETAGILDDGTGAKNLDGKTLKPGKKVDPSIDPFFFKFTPKSS
jgi:hypothetical protein